MTDQSDDRVSLLEALGRAPVRPVENLPATASAPLPDRPIGAQKVAVFRDEFRITEKLRQLAAAAGTNWYYRFPVRDKGATNYIEGPSIKLANDLARVYGNCEVDVRVTDLGDSWLFYARFTDFETGFTMTRPFQQRKGQRGMATSESRALDSVFQIGASKAIRNVIVNSLQTFADEAFEAARDSFVEKIGKNVEFWRDKALSGIADRKIELHRVERVIGRAARDWTAPDLARIQAMLKSISDGMSTIDDTFPSGTESGSAQREGQSTGESAAVPAASGEARVSALPDEPAPSADNYFEYAQGRIDSESDREVARVWFGSEAQRKLRKELAIDIGKINEFREKNFGK